MNIRWRDAARHYLQVVAFCFAVAVLTNLIWPAKSYFMQAGYSLAVGTITWIVIEFGRYLFDPKHCHADSAGGPGWPKGWRGLLLTAIGIACGFLLGDPLADQLFHFSSVNTPRDNRLSLAITVLAGSIASFYFHARGKAAAMAAQINAAERDASEARLKLLETQLEPHMLFNTLANLRVLITTDPPRAVAMLDRLNSYLRATLNGSRALSHSLDAEFELLRDYLELMSVRMGDRLAYALERPDALRHAAVPPLLLQPLVENAIQHGLEPQVGGGRITVRASQRGEGTGALLVVEVTDTGAGLAPQADALALPGRGFGLTQVRERLASAYGARGTIALSANAGGGTVATATFPLKISG